MDYRKLKSAAERITLPEDRKRRIAENCKTVGKERTMKKMHIRKPAAIAAALAVCLSLTVAAMAAPDTVKGFFRDVKDWRGAVVGTSYEQATDEIGMSVSLEDSELTVLTVFADTQIAPYKYVENLGIAAYEIVDATGKAVKEGAAESVEVINGCAVIPIRLDDLGRGSYKLTVTAFVAGAKAEQPLPLHGHWEAEFTR